MTKAMPFLQKAILLSYDPRRLLRREFFYLAGTIAQQHLPQVLGSDAQRLIFSLEQIDAAR